MFPPCCKEFSVYLWFYMQYGFEQNKSFRVQSKKWISYSDLHCVVLISSMDMSEQIHLYCLPYNVFFIWRQHFLEKGIPSEVWRMPSIEGELQTWLHCSSHCKSINRSFVSEPGVNFLICSEVIWLARLFVQVLSHSGTTPDDYMLLCLHVEVYYFIQLFHYFVPWRGCDFCSSTILL